MRKPNLTIIALVYVMIIGGSSAEMLKMSAAADNNTEQAGSSLETSGSSTSIRPLIKNNDLGKADLLARDKKLN